MNKRDIPSFAATKSRKRRSVSAATRDRPKAVQFLLPVWGHKYLTQFLEFGLPTLLAPGNIPAIAKELPSKFVFLTSAREADLLRVHPGVTCLESICDVECQEVDDLIAVDNASTTTTLAFARAVQRAGENMLDTCFFFLNSDYLVADGSLRNVLELMLNGASGVQAGNFQVVAEEAGLTFHSEFDRGSAHLRIEPRSLMSWSLRYLHPVTTANTVNFPLTHAMHSNRLFWRVDTNTLIGRFFLLHMICIRPEVTDFVVGSPCDYSFIPEMCPSNSVSVITDSDDYLVVEMQPRHHEQHYLMAGPACPSQLARSLAEWTTAHHRKNSESTFVFHAKDLPVGLDELLREADVFVGEVCRRLPKRPQPHRGHPFWIARRPTRMEQKKQTLSTTVGRIVYGCRYWVFGLPPRVRPFHPRWPDYRAILQTLSGLVRHPSDKIVIISSAPLVYSRWPASIADTVSLDFYRLLALDRTEYMPLASNFEGCVLILEGEELQHVGSLMARVRAMVVPGGFVLVATLNGRNLAIDESFNKAFVQNADRLFNLDAHVIAVSFTPITKLRYAVSRALLFLSRGLYQSSFFALPFIGIATMCMANLALLTGLGAIRRQKNLTLHGVLFSTACIALRLSNNKPQFPNFGPTPAAGYWHVARPRYANKKTLQSQQGAVGGKEIAI